VPDAIDWVYTLAELPFGKSTRTDLALATAGILATAAPVVGDGPAAALKVAARASRVTGNVAADVARVVGRVDGVAAIGKNAPTKLPAAQHTPYQVHIDPRTGRGPMAIETSTFTSGEATLNGGIRNPKQFWRQWSGAYGDTLSPANQAAVKALRSPVVDDAWIKQFPEHAPYQGETLIHHHLDYGRQAIPLPETVHGQQPGWGIWHPLHAGGS
jgi:hypothetical protein